MTLHLLPADDAGNMRGALVVDLQPGWKTYWIAPGPVGLAPELRFDGSQGLGPVTVDYPVPTRFIEGSETSVGFDAPTAFALRSTSTSKTPPVMQVDFLLGLCREICVPLQGHLDAHPDEGLSARAAVTAAFAALPDVAPAPSPVSARLSANGREITVTTGIFGTDDPAATVYVAGPPGWTFGLPVQRPDPTGTAAIAFTVPVERHPEPMPQSLSVDLLLTSGQTAQLSRSLAVSLP
ncbi:MAG: protein-disulfide reductase DsbD domain-containing protein [Methylobacterium sp.]